MAGTQTFLLKLETYDAERSLYKATVMDPNLGIWHEPILPSPPDQPPSSPGVPTFPIAIPPGSNVPPKPGYPPSVQHPIVIPPGEVPPDLPPDAPTDPNSRWVYTGEGWVFIYGPVSKPRPPGA